MTHKRSKLMSGAEEIKRALECYVSVVFLLMCVCVCIYTVYIHLYNCTTHIPDSGVECWKLNYRAGLVFPVSDNLVMFILRQNIFFLRPKETFSAFLRKKIKNKKKQQEKKKDLEQWNQVTQDRNLLTYKIATDKQSWTWLFTGHVDQILWGYKIGLKSTGIFQCH